MNDPNALSLEALFPALVKPEHLDAVLELALAEDLGEAGDVTSASIVGPDRRATARLVTRDDLVVAGLAAVPAVARRFEGSCAFAPRARDGERAATGAALGELSGSLRSILAVERTMLNLLGRLCGVATLTRRFVQAVSGTRAVICDTRKTTPGLRGLEKYAVRCGGGTLHRLGLHDALLYKDNHLALLPAGELAPALTAAIRRARAARDLLFVEVEVDRLEQLREVLAMEPGLVDYVLLDNMDPPALAKAVSLRDASGSTIGLEASGGVTLETVAAVAATGVERISVGALTHGAASADVGLDVVTGP